MAGAKFLRIYLNDHLTTAAAAAALAERMRSSGRGAAFEPLLGTLVTDFSDDLAQLERTMRDRGLTPSPVKRSLGTIGERLGRLKLNGRVRTPSPLTPLVELEGLTLLAEHNAALWRSLEAIGTEGAAERAERAERHVEELRAARREAAPGALTAADE
jgi:hypothetical protein